MEILDWKQEQGLTAQDNELGMSAEASKELESKHDVSL